MSARHSMQSGGRQRDYTVIGPSIIALSPALRLRSGAASTLRQAQGRHAQDVRQRGTLSLLRVVFLTRPRQKNDPQREEHARKAKVLCDWRGEYGDTSTISIASVGSLPPC